MTPVTQEFAHKPEEGQHGDCMRACLASLLDLPIAEVPHFAQLDADGDGDFWFGVTEFSRKHGYSFVIVQGSFVWAEDAIFHMIAGPSPRMAGVHHVVIGRNGQVFFDPHPSRAGLAGEPSEWTFYFLTRISELKEAA